MGAGRMDECYLTDQGMLIDLEEESDEVSPKTLKKFSKYGIFLNYWHYPEDIPIGVICHITPKKDFENLKLQERLFKVIGMKEFDNEIQRLVHDEFGEELDLKDMEIESKNHEIKEITKTNATFKRKIRELKDEIGDSIPPKVEEILNSLLVL